MTKPDSSYHSIYTYGLNDTAAVLAAYGEYLADPSTDPKTSIQVGVGTQVNPDFCFVFFGYDEATSTPKEFARFDNIPTQATLVPPTNGTLSAIYQVGSEAKTLGS